MVVEDVSSDVDGIDAVLDLRKAENAKDVQDFQAGDGPTVVAIIPHSQGRPPAQNSGCLHATH